MKVKVKLFSRVRLFCDPMDCSPQGSSIHGILQARILEWVAISFSRGSSQPKDWTLVSCIAGRRFNLLATREALMAFICWGTFLLYPICWYQHHKWILNFFKCFCTSIEMIIWFLSFILWMSHIGWFAESMKPSLHPWNKSRLIMVYDPFTV